MASDPSIYNQLGQGVPPIANPLAQAEQSYKLYGQMGQLAAGRAYQQAIDPVTGQLDTAKLMNALAQSPGAGSAIPAIQQSLLAQRKTQLEINAAQLNQNVARTNVVNGALAPLMRMGSNVSPQDIYTTIAGLHASGMPTDEFVQDAATTLPVKQPGMSDAQYGQQLQGWIVNHAARAWPAATQATAFTPTVGTVDAGGNIITRDTNPLTSPGITNAAPIKKGFTPAEQVTQVKGPVDAKGQPTVIPQAQYAQEHGLGDLNQGGGQSQSPFANGGRLPPALLNPNRQQVAAPPPPTGAGSSGVAAPAATPTAAGSATPVAAPAPGTPQYISHADQRFPAPGGVGAQPPAQAVSAQPGAPAASPAPGGVLAAAPSQYGQPMVVGLGPGQTAGATAAGDASAKQWAALQSSVGGSSGRIYQLNSALGDLQHAGPTGPSSGTINNMKSYLLSLPVVGQNLGIDPNQVASYDMANKYLIGYAAARAGRFGGTTDSQLATTLSSNASTHISGLAATDVVKANIGLERADQAQMAGFQNGLDPVTGQPTGQQFTPDQFADYSARWNTAHDLRAYVADKLSPQQFGTMVSGMSPADQARFQQTFNSGIAQGLIDPPAWLQPNAGSSAAPAATAAAPATSAAPASVPTAPPRAAAAPSVTATPAAVPTQSAAASPYVLPPVAVGIQ